MSEPQYKLPAVIGIDKEKCTQCHLCIAACPVKYCNDASKITEGIQVNHDLCIGCGECIKACTHKARIPLDDTEEFLQALQQHEKIGVLVAPAVDVNFPGQLPNLLGWLKSLGVTMTFDVSFGAEITTYQYVKALERGAKTPIIAQPCPAVVSYIETYRPQLIQHLAPTGSPVMDIATWVHQHHPGMKLAFLSPCLAKKREFMDPNTHGKIHYNVTIGKIKEYLAAQKIDLANFPSTGFDGPMEAERGLLFSQPGGLQETFKRYGLPLKPHQIRRIEGKEVYDEFLDELEKEIQKGGCEVILVDVLNCRHGCNRGTGTIYDERTTDDILRLQQQRLEKHKEKYYPSPEALASLTKLLSAMKSQDFERSYEDRSAAFTALQTPTADMITVLHEAMGKTKPQDIKNCGACGYFSCEAMAKAVLNDLYRPQQCHHYLEAYYREHSGDQD